MHRLLARQLRRHLAGDGGVPPEWADLLSAVSSAYEQADQDRLLLERSLELASQELMERFRQLQLDVERRREAEEALQRALDRHRLIARATNDTIWEWDLETGEGSWNEGIHAMFGWDPERAEPTHDWWVEQVHPDDVERVETHTREVLEGSGEVFTQEYRFRRADGSYASVLDRAIVTRDESGRAVRVVGSMTDMSERQRHEDALRASERQFRELAESMAAATFIYKGSGYLYVNAAATVLTGYSREELLASSFWDVVHPDDREMVRARGLARLRGEGVPPRYEFRIVTRGGEERWVDFTAGMISYRGETAALGTAFDITGHKEAEAALRWQALTFENLYDAVIITDLEGRIVHWNPAAQRIYGYTAAEVLGRTVDLWLRPEEAPYLNRMILESLERGGRWSGEIGFVRSDGSTGVSETVVVPLFDPRGERVGNLGVNRDVTDRKRAEEALRESELRYRTLFEESRDAIYMTTVDGRFMDANQAALDLFGCTREEMLSRDVRDMYAHAADRERFQDEIVRSGYVRDYEVRLARADGSPIDCLLSATLRRSATGEVAGYQGIIHDITERKRAEEQLAYGALHDALTSLPNRALFVDRLAHAIDRVRRGGDAPFAVLFLDLDRFKVINDSLGHAVGDELLVALARRLEATVGPADTVARFGGDEFTLLMGDVATAADATHAAERVMAALSAPFSLARQEVFTTASVGIALSSSGSGDPLELLRNADAALSRAKALGKARYEVFDRAMHTEAVGRLRMEMDLRRAVERGEFTLLYQPIVSLGSGRIAGFEALARWAPPTRGTVTPDEFVPLLEETGLILPFGRWVVEEACRRLAELRARHPGRALTVGVNVSPRQFSAPGLVEHVERTLAELQVPRGALHVEITESVIIENAEDARAALAGLRAAGVPVALDDFGTGYSSLGYLHRFPLDTLKIDRSFVQRMHEDHRSLQLVQAIVALARNLGVTVVAEGVDAPEQLAGLRALGCDFAQGYHFARPLRFEEAHGLVSADRVW